jgi:hypothetical protein
LNGLRLFWLAAAALVAAAIALVMPKSEVAPEPAVVATTGDDLSEPPPVENAHPAPVPAPLPSPPPARPPAIPADAAPTLGRGTEAEPFRISWDLLALGRDSLRDDGSLDLPPGLRAVDGQWIEIDGYFAAPLAVETTRELLVMLNRWDGCCIGVPPTAFDCIETTLAEPVELRGRHQIRFGPVRGVLRIEPFRIGELVLGFYRLEAASLRNG